MVQRLSRQLDSDSDFTEWSDAARVAPRVFATFNFFNCPFSIFEKIIWKQYTYIPISNSYTLDFIIIQLVTIFILKI